MDVDDMILLHINALELPSYSKKGCEQSHSFQRAYWSKPSPKKVLLKLLSQWSDTVNL